MAIMILFIAPFLRPYLPSSLVYRFDMPERLQHKVRCSVTRLDVV